jgi:hypothetical protein
MLFGQQVLVFLQGTSPLSHSELSGFLLKLNLPVSFQCWQQIEMSGSVTNELSALSTPVVGNVDRLFYWFRIFF